MMVGMSLLNVALAVLGVTHLLRAEPSATGSALASPTVKSTG